MIILLFFFFGAKHSNINEIVEGKSRLQQFGERRLICRSYSNIRRLFHLPLFIKNLILLRCQIYSMDLLRSLYRNCFIKFYISVSLY